MSITYLKFNRFMKRKTSKFKLIVKELPNYQKSQSKMGTIHDCGSILGLIERFSDEVIKELLK